MVWMLQFVALGTFVEFEFLQILFSDFEKRYCRFYPSKQKIGQLVLLLFMLRQSKQFQQS